MKHIKTTAVDLHFAAGIYFAGFLLILFISFLTVRIASFAEESHEPENEIFVYDEDDTELALPGNEDVYNILLIGSDRRDDGWNGNSDVMILVTINKNTKRIIMTSFMRDLYADIPEYGVHKLNYAYAAGGAEKLMETLEDNYGIEINNYAAVDFDGMADIIDLIGGVELEVTDEEVSLLNSYLSSENKDQSLPCGGVYRLSGAQAVAYMRIRYVGNADYERTQRQRTVLSEIFDMAKEMSAAELVELAQEAIEFTEHDISPLDMITLFSSLGNMTKYDLVENRIPYDGMYTSEGEMLVPDYSATIEKLNDVLYGYGEGFDEE